MNENYAKSCNENAIRFHFVALRMWLGPLNRDSPTTLQQFFGQSPGAVKQSTPVPASAATPGVKGAQNGETDTTWITREDEISVAAKGTMWSRPSQVDPQMRFLTHRVVRRGARVEAYIGERRLDDDRERRQRQKRPASKMLAALKFGTRIRRSCLRIPAL
jgi:hypothetical protein